MHAARTTLRLTIAALALAACSAQKEPEKAPANAAAAAPAIPVVSVHARDFAFTAPSQLTAGATTFHFVNDGPGLHHMTIVRLDSGKTMADLSTAMKKPGPMPAWAVLVGGPNAVGPGDSTSATLNLDAGNYVMMCLVDVPGGVPHFAKGMIQALTVTPASGAAAAAPTADVTLKLADYSFTPSKPLAAGKHTIAITNNGPQAHEVEFATLEPGKTAQDLLKWVMNMQGPPPGHAIGGSAPLDPGKTGYYTVDLAPGTYAMICFVPDTKDGKPHALHGMAQTITVQ
jgi:uncharacterized cupredoxin-like copper-binding protein